MIRPARPGRRDPVATDFPSTVPIVQRLLSEGPVSDASLSAKVHRRRFISAVSTLAAVSPMFWRAANSSAAAPDERMRVAVIGHTGRGDFGHGLSTVWLKVPEAEIVAVADADAKGLAREKEKTGAKQSFLDYREMIAETRPDIVVVCPRHIDQHHEMILAAIDGGAKGIYCEKPFCRTLDEADEIVAACERTGAKVAIAHRNRYHPAVPAIIEAIQSGAIGKPLEIRCRGKEDGRGGAQDLWVLGTHLFNLVPQFSGKVTACSAVMMHGKRPVTPADVVAGTEGVGPIAGDELHARYETENGIPVFFDSIRNHGVASAGFGLQIIGNEGIIDLRMDTEPLAHYVPGSPFRPSVKPRPWIPISSAGIGKPEPIEGIGHKVAHHLVAVDDLIAAIREDRPPLCSAEDGRATLEMVHGVYASHVAGGKAVSIPLATRTHPFLGWQVND
ncbi:1,5-anhydro-D-fructose reductase [Roseimaritima multifibrata]|uniref:1,5-anhydro-D-fructose reductase n=1 Tax=Roseimaritima multifibrata TaxID=1930274 RepID=A0A517MGR9_9BACT|nr:Gfo/Idh/MocA family oxidoreductase [Roseimaritima multifibrata]QDS93957.1 1,5-anhydro-D-fructose reductase [Roseimaritima multifibrata]